jgi:hypothetical protein
VDQNEGENKPMHLKVSQRVSKDSFNNVLSKIRKNKRIHHAQRLQE